MTRQIPALLGVVLLIAAGLWSTGRLDPLLHPARFATTGAATLPADAYAAAADAVLPADARIAVLTLPADEGPVRIVADTGAQVWLDGPSARVLDAAPGSATPAPRAIASPALSPAAAALLARPLAGGARLTRIAWPGEHNPDWTLRFEGAGGAHVIKVADDTGTATPARTSHAVAARLVRDVDGDAALAIGSLTIAAAAALWFALRRRARRQATKRKRRP